MRGSREYERTLQAPIVQPDATGVNPAPLFDDIKKQEVNNFIYKFQEEKKSLTNDDKSPQITKPNTSP